MSPATPAGGPDAARSTHQRLLRRYPALRTRLQPDETLVAVEEQATARPAAPPSALAAMRALTRAPRGCPLNESGPALAATTARDDGAASGHLRLFEAVFGRDSLICARMLLTDYPGVARRTVLALAAAQGLRDATRSEEEPGRIPHEIRDPTDPVAHDLTTEYGWAWPYYGSIDATCLWITSALEVARRDPGFPDEPVTGRDGRRRRVAECLAAAVEWLLARLAATPSGLLESTPRFPGSIQNQVWKDSPDAYSHRDGELATPATIASVEVQGLAYEALVRVDALADRLPGGRRRVRAAAAHVRARVLADFWVQDEAGGFFASGLDRDGLGRARPLAVRTSTMGHLLLSPILDGDAPALRTRRSALMDALAAPDLLCAAGLRTLSTTADRYRPDAYHNGSSWPWDTFTVAQGLRRHGRAAQADDLCARITRACREVRLYPEFFPGEGLRLPNLVVDVVDAAGQPNRVAQPPQEIQAWTVAAVLAIKRSCGRRGVAARGSG